MTTARVPSGLKTCRPAHCLTSAASPCTTAKPAQALLVLRGTMEVAQVAFQLTDSEHSRHPLASETREYHHKGLFQLKQDGRRYSPSFTPRQTSFRKLHNQVHTSGFLLQSPQVILCTGEKTDFPTPDFYQCHMSKDNQKTKQKQTIVASLPCKITKHIHEISQPHTWRALRPYLTQVTAPCSPTAGPHRTC